MGTAEIQSNVFEVAEIHQTNSYTYLKVKEASTDRWMAVTKQEINKGDVFYYDEALPMSNFHSKELDRTFDEIYFVNQISKTPFLNHPAAGFQGMGNASAPDHSGNASTHKSAGIKIEKAAGELTIAEIFENSKKYSGQQITVRGVVVKVNRQIMGKNWIHIQDGTESNGHFDLTVTTNTDAEVNDEISIRGKLTLDKDFGAGYFYEVIMEEGEIVNHSSAGHF